MLVVTQKLNVPIRLTLPDGREVVLHLVEIGQGRIRVGIEAPRDVMILRDDAKRKGA